MLRENKLTDTWFCDQEHPMPKKTLDLQAEQRILILRDQKVMLDFHLAELYGVETRVWNQS